MLSHTNIHAPSITRSRAALRRAIARQRDAVLDWDIVVDDARRDVDRALEALREGVRERGRAAVHLAHLCDLDETAETISTFRLTIAPRDAAPAASAG